MKWSEIKLHLRSIWLINVKKSYQEVRVTAMLSKRFARRWDEYPWQVSETLRFSPLSLMGDLYLVEKILCKQYVLPDGQVKTEVEDRKAWKAVYNNNTHILMDFDSDLSLIAFIPEKKKILFGAHEYDEKYEL